MMLTSHAGVPASPMRLREMLTDRFRVFEALAHSTIKLHRCTRRPRVLEAVFLVAHHGRSGFSVSTSDTPSTTSWASRAGVGCGCMLSAGESARGSGVPSISRPPDPPPRPARIRGADFARDPPGRRRPRVRLRARFAERWRLRVHPPSCAIAMARMRTTISPSPSHAHPPTRTAAGIPPPTTRMPSAHNCRIDSGARSHERASSWTDG